MAESTGAAPAVAADTSTPALPEGMLSMPKVLSSSKKKMDAYDLENDAEDQPIVKKASYEDESDGLAESTGDKTKGKTKQPPKKAKAPVQEEPDEEDDVEESGDDEDESDDSDEDDEPVKPRKKRALDIVLDDEEEDSDDGEDESNDEPVIKEIIAEDLNNLKPEELTRKFKFNIKDGDKVIPKEWSLKQLIDMAQRNETGDVRLYQAEELYKKSEGTIQRLMSEPFEVMKYVAAQTGKDYYQLIEAEMANQFKLKMMTPEERTAFEQAENDKQDLARYRQEQVDLKIKLEQEELTKTQTKIANDFVSAVGDIITTDPYLKHVYDNLDEGDDKNYIIRKFGSFIQNGLIMKQIPQGQKNHLPANFDLSPKNPIIVKLVSDEIKREQEDYINKAAKAAKIVQQQQKPEILDKNMGNKNREKIPGVKSKAGKPNKLSSKEKKAKRQSTYDFLRDLTG